MSQPERTTDQGKEAEKERGRPTSSNGESTHGPEPQEQIPKKLDSNEIKIVHSLEGALHQESKYSDKSLRRGYYWNYFANDPDRDTLNSNSKDSFSRAINNRQLNREPEPCIEKILICLSYLLVLICFPVSLFCVFVVVRQFERAVILRNGKVHGHRAFGPGLIHYMPCIDVVKFTDLRISCYSVPPQEVLTKDSLTVSADAVVFYRICDPIGAVINVADYRRSTQFLACTTLRNALGTRKLSELLSDRKPVCLQIFQLMKRIAREWGIKIVRVEVKDIWLPIQLQKTMAAEAESSRLANAKIIIAKAEIETTKNLQLATTLLMDNPLCMQLRYLQSLHMIASEKTHTIVFPLSIETFSKIFK